MNNRQPFLEFEDLPSTDTAISATNLNNMQIRIGEDIDKNSKITNLKSIIEAPSIFGAGDMYYNSSDDLIYTAISSSEWDEGKSPMDYKSYLDETDNNIYVYYNNTMNLESSKSKLNQMIVDYTVPSDTNSIEFTGLHIQPGEQYKFRIVGCGTSDADIHLTFNNITSNYYNAGYYSDGTATTSSTDLTRIAGYRPLKENFYYGLHLSTRPTQIDGTISIRKNLTTTDYYAFFTWNSNILWSGSQLMSNCLGAYGAANVPSITSLQFRDATFMAGTRIQIIKVNNDFTI